MDGRKSSPTSRRRIVSWLNPLSPELARVPGRAWLHHEKLDGSGYPQGLGEADIPPPARMMTICDIFDALSASTVHKPFLPGGRRADFLRAEADRASSTRRWRSRRRARLRPPRRHSRRPPSLASALAGARVAGRPRPARSPRPRASSGFTKRQGEAPRSTRAAAARGGNARGGAAPEDPRRSPGDGYVRKDGTISHVSRASIHWASSSRDSTFRHRRARARFPLRVTRVPRQEVTIFNRSHYEDILVPRVHRTVEPPVWKRRYGQIPRRARSWRRAERRF
jgi:hypothetical protein